MYSDFSSQQPGCILEVGRFLKQKIYIFRNRAYLNNLARRVRFFSSNLHISHIFVIFCHFCNILAYIGNRNVLRSESKIYLSINFLHFELQMVPSGF